MATATVLSLFLARQVSAWQIKGSYFDTNSSNQYAGEYVDCGAGCTAIANVAYGLASAYFVCPRNSPCSFTCSAYKACSSMDIICPETSSCDVTCIGEEACSGVLLAVYSSISLNINCSGENSCASVEL